MIVTIMIICAAVLGAMGAFPPNDTTSLQISSRAFVASENQQSTRDYEWVTDTGSNRFVTNDVRDFDRGSIVYKNTRVLVGSGEIVSPCEGTVTILCRSTGRLIQCRNTLLLANCEKKLMPARPFLRKGCNLTMSEEHGVQLFDEQGEIIMQGKEIDGLYYYDVVTVREGSAVHPSA